MCEAATFRYCVAILLRLLPVRWGGEGSEGEGRARSCCSLQPRSCFCPLQPNASFFPRPLRRELQQRCCAMLADAVARMLRQPGAAGAARLGALLPAVLSTLGEAIEAEHAAGRPLNTPAVKSLLELAAQLTTGAPEALRPYLRQVDPLPDGIPALAQPAAVVAAARQDVTPCEQLSQVGGSDAPGWCAATVLGMPCHKSARCLAATCTRPPPPLLPFACSLRHAPPP